MRLLYYDAPEFRDHNTGPGHPERAARLDAIAAGIQASHLAEQIVKIKPPAVDLQVILKAHTARHLDRVLAAAGKCVRFDGDTATSAGSVQAALLAAGAVVDATLRVLREPNTTAFCAIRPPGHHAERDQAMGFCLFNNVAIAAYAALNNGCERVLIFDPDVHHGNGTQHIFETDPRVFYISIHQYPFYPGTGSSDEVGLGEGKGFTANFPLPAGCGDADYAAICQDGVATIVENYQPDLIIFSAGFDAHEDDPLGGMRLSSHGFVELYRPILRAAREGNIPYLFALEGGYSLSALQATVPLVMANAILDEHPANPTNLDNTSMQPLIKSVLAQLNYRF